MKLMNVFLLGFLFVSCGEEEYECAWFIPNPIEEDSYNFNPDDRYDFPVRPGSQEWSVFTTGQQMIDACQVPDVILDQMSTNGLIETCLDYPLLSNMFAFSSIQLGTKRQMENFNGFGKLVQKNDAATLMLARYRLIDASLVSNENDVSIGDFSVNFISFGMALSQLVFIEQLSTLEKKELVHDAMLKYEVFLLDQEIFGLFILKVQALIMARTMQAEGYRSFLKEIEKNEFLTVFVSDADLQNNIETLNIIIDYAKQFTCN